MPLLDYVKSLAQKEKTKTKVRSDDGKYITKTKVMKTPLNDEITKVVTKKVKRPTLLGGANDKKEVTKDVTYESNPKSTSQIGTAYSEKNPRTTDDAPAIKENPAPTDKAQSSKGFGDPEGGQIRIYNEKTKKYETKSGGTLPNIGGNKKK